ncbi:hypothetical protein MRB53_031614 [Persea americana]|uniref:Uncharacterized protein n=1 Tax=Persea americana TaxID=3435 RepID=A0ACC2KPK8_PERAE|nr:hypothetical protein MRB53_031614 [Persea americana]
MKGTLRYLIGAAGPSGFGSNSTAEQVTENCSSLISPHLTAIITGATSGIGAETARVLAKRGLRIVIPARDLKKAAEVKERIQKESPKNNAGKFSDSLEFSEDKFEMTFATNYLGHFLLTEVLLERMIETAAETGIEGRIINVSSIIHSWAKKEAFQFIDMVKPKSYNGTRAYAQSKLANILHAKEVARQLKAMNARVTINAVHPGIVKTGIIRDHKGLITDSVFFLASKLLKSTAQGASTTCHVALSPQLNGISGKYFADCNESSCSVLANDEKEARKLWKQTRTLIYKRLCQPSSSKPV